MWRAGTEIGNGVWRRCHKRLWPMRRQQAPHQRKGRKEAAYNQGFLGAHAISQAMLFNSHPVGKSIANERMEALVGVGGVQACGNAQNCVAVCPKEIPLTTSIARAGRAATIYSFKKFFDR